MDISDVQIGQRIVVYRKGGMVVGKGACYWPGCRYGRDCVEVQHDDQPGTEFYRASMLVRVPVSGAAGQ